MAMAVSTPVLRGFGIAALGLLIASPLSAQIEDQLSAYTGRNAIGYLRPLADALGADLNSGFFHSAHIPKNGFHLSLEIRYMSVIFADDDRTFSATTEYGFSPEQTVDAPTIVGPRHGVRVSGNGATNFSFPGGFDVDMFEFATPQIRIGTLLGTEALLRFLIFETGSVDFGDLKLKLFGVGVRHSISQYTERLPAEVAVGVIWQTFSLAEQEGAHDLMSTKTLSVGLHASKRLSFVEPYAGFSVDTYQTKLSYVNSALGLTESIDFDFGTDTSVRTTVGLSLYRDIFGIHGEFNFTGQNSFSIGLVVGK